MGYARNDFAGKPVIGIINTWSDLLPCHAHFRTRAEEVKRGVWQAGGFPVELPVMAVSETVPEADQHDVPQFPRDGDRGDAALAPDRRRGADGRLRQDDARRSSWARPRWGCRSSTCRRARCCAATGRASSWAPAPIAGSTGRSCAPAASPSDDWREVEEGIARSYGHCMVMGTASTMTSAAETLGLTLPGAASIPAADSGHPRMATASGRRIVEMVWEDLRPAAMLTPQGLRQCDHCGARALRIDQRADPPDRDGGARRHRAEARPLRRARAARAGARQPAARRAST